jgi:hypothetical protein
MSQAAPADKVQWINELLPPGDMGPYFLQMDMPSCSKDVSHRSAADQLGYDLARWLFQCYKDGSISLLSAWRDKVFSTFMTVQEWCTLRQAIGDSDPSGPRKSPQFPAVLEPRADFPLAFRAIHMTRNTKFSLSKCPRP